VNTPPVELDIIVNTTPERAFQVFTAEMSRWWPPSHHIGEGELIAVHIEPREGGRWYETTTAGTECDWGYVIAWNPLQSVTLAWQLDHEFHFDPKLVTTVTIRFDEIEPGRTQVSLQHGHLDQYGVRSIEMYDVFSQDGGWPSLLASYRVAIEYESITPGRKGQQPGTLSVVSQSCRPAAWTRARFLSWLGA
jgi:Activator of Hsp90 ATPase homolog 1-like protein